MGGAQTASGRRNHLAMFDRKVCEADSYLQLVIEQTSKIDSKIAELEDQEDKDKYKALQDQANVRYYFFGQFLLFRYIFLLLRVLGHAGQHKTLNSFIANC